MEQKEHIIDAQGQKLGRIATSAAHFLMGKDTPHFVKHRGAFRVVIKNANGLILDEKKRKQKIYVHYTGHPGGKREIPMERVLDRKGVEEVIRKAVYGMLPANKLRKERMKQLTVEV